MEQATDIQLLFREIRRQGREIAELKALITKGKITDVWLPEADAAALIGQKPRTLRARVTNPLHKYPMDVEYRTEPSGRGYQYKRADMLTYLRDTKGRSAA